MARQLTEEQKRRNKEYLRRRYQLLKQSFIGPPRPGRWARLTQEQRDAAKARKRDREKRRRARASTEFKLKEKERRKQDRAKSIVYWRTHEPDKQGTKYCGGCKQRLTKTQFSLCRSNSDGFQTTCKECQRKKVEAWKKRTGYVWPNPYIRKPKGPTYKERKAAFIANFVGPKWPPGKPRRPKKLDPVVIAQRIARQKAYKKVYHQKYRRLFWQRQRDNLTDHYILKQLAKSMSLTVGTIRPLVPASMIEAERMRLSIKRTIEEIHEQHLGIT